MSIVIALLIYVALVISLSLATSDYSFDGITKTMYYGYYKSLLAMGDSVYILLSSQLLMLLGFEVTALGMAAIGAAILLARPLFALLFERHLISTSPEIISFNVASALIMTGLIYFESFILLIPLAALLLAIFRSGRVSNPYDPDFFERIVRIYVRSLSQELKFIAKATPNITKRRALNAILITESVNRPAAFRFIENLMFKTKLVKSVGIMQVSGQAKMLDNKESILAASKFLDSLKTTKPSVEDYVRFYNGNEYAKVALEVDDILISL